MAIALLLPLHLALLRLPFSHEDFALMDQTARNQWSYNPMFLCCAQCLSASIFFCHTEMVAWLVLAMLLPCKLLTSNFSLLLLTVAFSRHKLITLLCIYKVFSAVCTMRCTVNVCFHKRLYLYITSSLCSPFYVVQMVASCDCGLNNLLQLWEHISEQQRTKIRQTSKPHYSLMIHRHAKQGLA